jgi:hypothetical protein
VHDAHALEHLDLVAERLAHATDLAVEPLRQNDPEHLGPDREDAARPGGRVGQAHAGAHGGDELGRDRAIDRDHVLLLVVVLGAQHLVDDVAVVGQQDQPLRVLVEPPDREDPLGVIDEVDDVAGDVALGGARDPDRLVERDVDRPRLLARAADALAVEAHVVAVLDLGPERGGHAVDGDAALGDEGVGFATRARPALAQVLVQTHGDADGTRVRYPEVLCACCS